MAEDDLGSIGLLRRQVNQMQVTLDDFGRRLAVLEGRERSVPRPRDPLRGTGSLRDPDLAGIGNDGPTHAETTARVAAAVERVDAHLREPDKED